MKGFRKYPNWVWGTLAVVVVIAALFQHPMVAFALVLITAILQGARHWYLNPLGKKTAGYRQWLKTVPYKAGDRLPNGSVLPDVADLVFLTALIVPVWFI